MGRTRSHHSPHSSRASEAGAAHTRESTRSRSRASSGAHGRTSRDPRSNLGIFEIKRIGLTRYGADAIVAEQHAHQRTVRRFDAVNVRRNDPPSLGAAGRLRCGARRLRRRDMSWKTLRGLGDGRGGQCCATEQAVSACWAASSWQPAALRPRQPHRPRQPQTSPLRPASPLGPVSLLTLASRPASQPQLPPRRRRPSRPLAR